MMWIFIFLMLNGLSLFPEEIKEENEEMAEISQELDLGRKIAKLVYKESIDDDSLEELDDLKTFKGETGVFPKETHCAFVAEHDDTLVVAIRGTKSKEDWQTDLDILKIDVPDDLGLSQGQVHEGFYNYAKSVFKNILPELLNRMKETKIKNVSVYGHSLGGAGAQILALLIKNKDADINIKVFTYESPRVFDAAAAVSFDEVIGKENHIRVIQSRGFTDIITELPPEKLGFKHTGTLCEIKITKETEKQAKKHLHFMVPITNAQVCFEAGKKHLSNREKVDGALKKVKSFSSKIKSLF